jgi:hypothetical protein
VAGRQWTDDEFALLRSLANGPAADMDDLVRKMGESLGETFSRSQIAGVCRPLRITAESIKAAHLLDGSESANLQKQLREAKAELRKLRDAALTDDKVRREVIGVNLDDAAPPDWLIETTKAKRGPGAPCVLASDWHHDEVVDPAQINGVNEYNREIAHRRIRTFAEGTIDVLTQHMVRPEYPGIVFALAGDMVSGEIHDELQATNEAPALASVVDLFGKLAWVIEQFASAFGNVFVPCVTGNHGRTTKKIWAKNRVYTSLDWLLYTFLEKRFENDDRVRFMVSPGPDLLFQVYATRFLLTHGDRLGRGGDGLIGMLGPVTRGKHRRRSRNAAVDLPYDTLVAGHWHQYTPTPRVIVNGSLIGFNEFAWTEGFAPEPPRQALWVVHPERGTTFHAPVWVEKPKIRRSSSEWVAWSQAA